MTQEINLADNIDEPKVLFAVRRIKPLSFFIDEFGFMQDEREYLVRYNNKFGYNLEDNIVDFTLQAYYAYQKFPDKTVLSIDVQNLFEVKDLQQFIGEDRIIKLPNKLLVTMVSLAVSHTRALLAQNTAGSMYNEVMLPIVNPNEMANAFFKDLEVKV